MGGLTSRSVVDIRTARGFSRNVGPSMMMDDPFATAIKLHAVDAWRVKFRRDQFVARREREASEALTKATRKHFLNRHVYEVYKPHPMAPVETVLKGFRKLRLGEDA